MIKKYLVILDDLELAIKNKPNRRRRRSWAEGIDLISRKLQTIIESKASNASIKNNVTLIPTCMKPFHTKKTPT